MAIYVVGDIQGCFKPLRKMLKKVGFDAARDKLWCAGDLVNRGPDSLKTLRFLKDLGHACICVLGNHDLHLLELAAGGTVYGRDMLRDVLEAPDCNELIDWLRQRPVLHFDESRRWCMVHAALHPGWSLAEATDRARAVERELKGEHWKEFCRQLHHVKFPIREPAPEDPTHVLFDAAVFTRARYCTADGIFNWNVRTGESSKKSDKPWFAHKKIAWRNECNVVYGHWAAMGLVTDQPHVLGLDSGCVWGGSLSMVKLKKNGKWKNLTAVKCAPFLPSK
ncbi:MAG TPA: symmetrical bis(5'-nucleosyl)-tetraphosphatase [Mariprofundaceae bacterium]|nr:symmetrical bis(5'-nucleosyl)-tetraphosphatase [Mariprofundaceae bacterium]